MNKKLQEERAKAMDLLNYAKSQQQKVFNLSDLKSDKTQIMDSPNHNNRTGHSEAKSPFKPSEISARSTLAQIRVNDKTFSDFDFDEIMQSSTSAAVRSKYRESIGATRMSSVPKTADMSLRSTITSSAPRHSELNDFWDKAQVSSNSFNGANMSVASADFNAGNENLSEMFGNDEIEQKKEFAPIPVPRTNSNESNWENQSMQPEMSFGRYAHQFVKNNNIRDLYGNKSPPKRSKGMPLVELSNIETPQPSSRLGTTQLRKIINDYDTPTAQQLMLNFNKHVNKTADEVANSSDKTVSRISSMISSLNFDKIVEMTEKEKQRMRAEKERSPRRVEQNKSPRRVEQDKSPRRVEQDKSHRQAAKDLNEVVHDISDDDVDMDNVPVRDEYENRSSKNRLHPERQQSYREDFPARGTKRRSSLEPTDTPKTTHGKCMRSKSPTQHKELRAVAASLLKPILDEENFKVPQQSINQSQFSFNPKSPGSSRGIASSTLRSPSSREYITANSMPSSGEKLSLPNYSLQRPGSTFTSPTSNRSGNQSRIKQLHALKRTSSQSSNESAFTSPTSNRSGGQSRIEQLGELKRTSSQLSNGSEFHEDDLPIKIKKAHRKLSWETVKLFSSSSKSISIQNGSNKKLSMRVRTEGAGFSVTPRDEFRMIPLEARTFEVKFSPTTIGAVRGQLIFELVSNNKCFKSIPLFAYGGHATLRIDGVQKGPIGPSFITMGHVKILNQCLRQTLVLTNNGTLPGFAALVFEKTKWSDFSLSHSLTMRPSEVRLAPGESVSIDVRFNATKEEIRKIIALNKEVTIVGEICIICGDEPTRLRLLANKTVVPPQFIKFLPKNLPRDVEIKRDLVLFNEDLDATKLSKIMEKIRTHEVALTIGRNLDETQIFADLSLADDTSMTFETFCETNVDRTVAGDMNESCYTDNGFLESKFFRVTPAQVNFNRQVDKPEVSKVLTVTSTHSSAMYVEAVSSKHDYISAVKSCGLIKPGESVEIRVCPKLKAFQYRTFDPMYVTVMIENAKIDVPVCFFDY